MTAKWSEIKASKVPNTKEAWDSLGWAYLELEQEIRHFEQAVDEYEAAEQALDATLEAERKANEDPRIKAIRVLIAAHTALCLDQSGTLRSGFCNVIADIKAVVGS